MNDLNHNQDHPLYRLGEYMIRRCGFNGWEYCNGNCTKCHNVNARYIATDHTIIRNNDSIISTTTTSSHGFPQYLIKKGEPCNDI